MSKATISTGGHLIDKNCQYQTGTIVEANNSVYDCTLNQTDIGANKNKFYIMQIIGVSKTFYVYISYGRIGERGKQLYNTFGSEDQAIAFFEKQFKSKTGNAWSQKDNFVKKPKKYFMAEIETVELSDNAVESGSSEDSEELDSRVVDFLKLISNTTYMTNALVQLEIDTEKMPLGKINQTQIDKAFEILEEILDNLKEKAELVKLSSEFYTLVPYACGRKKPPLIDNKKIVGKNVNLLNELSQMVYGTLAAKKLKKNKGNMIKMYQDLKTTITPLDKTDEMYQILVEYLANSKAPTHHFSYKVLDIFEIEREGERDLYEAYSKKLKNKTLLFHGTRVANFCSILSGGLICDPSKLGINIHITGKMFGYGVYMANSCSKSIQYCGYDTSDNIACLLVIEVALGKQLQKKQADVTLSAKTLPKGYHSTRGVGKNSFEKYDEYNDGTIIPAGKLKTIVNNSDSSLLYLSLIHI